MTPHEKKEILNDLPLEENVTKAAILGAEDQNEKTLKYKKEAVRQVIIRSVPSVIDLAFGCKVMFNDHERIVITNERGYITFDIGSPMENLKVERLYKIIGRPIQLSDILIAIPSVVYVNTDGYFIKNEGYAPLGQWDLSQDFDHQQELTIDFLWSLLCE